MVRALGVVRWIDWAIERRIWDEAELAAKFCVRSPRRILREGHIHYAAPCPDLAGLTAALLRLNGLRPVLVLARVARPFRPVKFQCGVEVPLDGTLHTVGWSITTRRVEAGRYRPARHRDDIRRTTWEANRAGRPYLEPFEVRGPADLERVLRGYDHLRHLATYRRTRSRRRFRGAIRRTAEKIRAGGPALVPSQGRWRAADAGGDLAGLDHRPPTDPTRDDAWRGQRPPATATTRPVEMDCSS